MCAYSLLFPSIVCSRDLCMLDAGGCVASHNAGRDIVNNYYNGTTGICALHILALDVTMETDTTLNRTPTQTPRTVHQSFTGAHEAATELPGIAGHVFTSNLNVAHLKRLA